MKLTPEENAEYIQWARDNYHTKVGISGPIKAIWHPVARQEMHRLRRKQMAKIKLKVKEMESARLEIRYE
jgi:predicted Rossmann-fold nucleotide-binding protein